MTTICLNLTDQVLVVTQKPRKIAAGDVNSVVAQFTFDDVWKNYMTKHAIFYTSYDPTVYEVSLKLGTSCKVPPEVLYKEGTLFIGMRATRIEDGKEVTKTSSIVKLKIVKGATASRDGAFLTESIFSQYVSDTIKHINPIVEAEIDKWDERVQQRENQLNEFLITALTTLSGDVVWTNSNENASFGGTTIPENLSDYVRFVVTFKHETDSERYLSTEITEKGKKYLLHSTDINSSNIYTEAVANRTVRVNSDGIYFSNGYRKNEDDTYNNLCIPCKIIGYKY